MCHYGQYRQGAVARSRGYNQLSTHINVPAGAREDFQNLVRELVDWRLAEYLGRGESGQESGRSVCRVLHTGGRPILKLPDRQMNAGIPFGWVDVLANDQPHVANFAKEQAG